MEKSEVLFVAGAHKTGTSTLVGLLNCHPDIIILYETGLYQPLISRHGKNFLEQYPDGRFLFRSLENWQPLYSQLQAFLTTKGYPYKYVGDKLPGLDGNLLRTLNDFKVFFIIRDIRTWLCKNVVVQKYFTEHDIIPAAIDYAIYFLKSFKLPQIFHIRMEDLITPTNSMLIKEMGNFLSLDLDRYAQNWWKKVEISDPNNPKASDRWWEQHSSALYRPEGKDTVAQITPHHFWENLLPLFDKYYKNVGAKFKTSEIDQDIDHLLGLKTLSPLSLSEAFHRHESFTISEAQNYRNKIKSKIKNKIKKIMGF